MSLRRLSTAAVTLLLGLGMAGCATSSYDTAHQTAKQRQEGQLAGHEIADSENDGTYVSAGPITYQLEVSRQLNPYSVQDRQYFAGLPAGTSATGLAPDQLWYGVFLWAKNQHHQPHWTSNRFELLDTQGRVYHPIKLDASANPLAWSSTKLPPGGTQPGEDSIAAQFFEGGQLVLFKLSDSIYSNRPLTLYILSPQNKRIGEISLDL